MDSIEKMVKDLCRFDTEKEWFEFKENRLVPRELGEYISALSNSAVYEGREFAYLVWGINDKTHEITGTL